MAGTIKIIANITYSRPLAGAEVRGIKTLYETLRLYGYNKDQPTTSGVVDYDNTFPLYHAPFILKK